MRYDRQERCQLKIISEFENGQAFGVSNRSKYFIGPRVSTGSRTDTRPANWGWVNEKYEPMVGTTEYAYLSTNDIFIL